MNVAGPTSLHEALVAAAVLGVAQHNEWLKPGAIIADLPALRRDLRDGIAVDCDRAVCLTLGLLAATGGYLAPRDEAMVLRVLVASYDQLVEMVGTADNAS